MSSLAFGERTNRDSDFLTDSGTSIPFLREKLFKWAKNLSASERLKSSALIKDKELKSRSLLFQRSPELLDSRSTIATFDLLVLGQTCYIMQEPVAALEADLIVTLKWLRVIHRPNSTAKLTTNVADTTTYEVVFELRGAFRTYSMFTLCFQGKTSVTSI